MNQKSSVVQILKSVPQVRTKDSGKGNCYDNAAVETFFKTIKAELIVFKLVNAASKKRRRLTGANQLPLAIEDVKLSYGIASTETGNRAA